MQQVKKKVNKKAEFSESKLFFGAGFDMLSLAGF